MFSTIIYTVCFFNDGKGLLKKSAPSRIIHVSSMAHAFTKHLHLDNLNSEKSYDAGSV